MNAKSITTILGITAMAFLFVQAAEAQPPAGKKRGGEMRSGSSDRMGAGGSMNRPQRGDRGPRGERPGPEMLIERFDKNDDGKLAADEVSDKMKKRFKKIDIDEDGFVTVEELKTAMASRRGRGGERGNDGEMNGGGEGKRGQGRGGKGNRNADPAKFMERFDKDADGKLSLTEAPERMQNKFDKMDANEDGFLDAAELKSVMEKMKSARGGKGGKGGKNGGKKGKRGGDGDLNPVKPKAPPAGDFPL